MTARPDAEAIARALGGRRNGSGWRARCPAHNDHDPSLDITEKNGTVLLVCRAGCGQGAVLDALRRRGLWSDRPASGAGDELIHPTLGAPDMAFEYRGIDSKLIGAVCRWNLPSGKKAIRPAIREAGGWRWKAFPAPRPLYCLPDLAAHAERPVLIVEGEKTADAARELIDSYIVTTWPGGTGAVRLVDLDPLKGRDVVLWPDADPAGDKAMRILAARLIGARSVRQVKLPTGLPEGWDLADAIPADLDPVALVRAASDADRSDSTAGPLGEWDAGLDDYHIPPRGWLLGATFCRGFLSSLLGGGGVAKTTLRIVQALSLATGRELTGEHVFHRSRVLLLSFEDGRDELRRRVRAAMVHHDIKAAELTGWFFLAAPKGLRLAEIVDGSPRAGELETILRETIARRGIDLVILDPFIKTHAVEENSNSGIDFVCSLLVTLATELNVAVDVPHHVRKGAPTAGDADSGRGAGSFKDAGRLIYTLTKMMADEAQALGVSESERRRLVRLDSAKVNIAPPADDATWFKVVGVELGNATPAYPSGDTVQTVEPWTAPDLWRVVNTIVANDILDKIAAGLANGGRYSDSATAGPERAAWRLVHAAAPDLAETQCRTIIATWIKTGVLFRDQYYDRARRKKLTGLFVNATKRPGKSDG
jgi:AAA domain-containing protein